MNLSLGIVGLPNVGKSTLFNALTKQQVLAANYPFATIDPNHGIVAVHDQRLIKIAEVEKPTKVVPAVVEFVDIAGLVKGASEGEGLGNQFLANIREVSAIVHLVRAFKDDNITHVENSVNTQRDIELINTELILKDLESVEKRIKDLSGKSKSNPKLVPAYEYFTELQKYLSDGNLAKSFTKDTTDEISMLRKEMFLLTDKPVIYLVNSSEDLFEAAKTEVQNMVDKNDLVIAMDVKQESELALMTEEERSEFMIELGIERSGLDILTEEAYKVLGLISFFTSGQIESRAWTIVNGDTAPVAAGTIHTDIQTNFIAADVVNWEDFVNYGGWNKARENGKVRLEGKNYVMQDGDVVLFKHNG